MVKRVLGLLFAVIGLFISGLASGQPYPVRAGVHLNLFDLKSGKTGVGAKIIVSRLYLDMSSNFATGDGLKKELSTSETYWLQKKHAGVLNAGYIFPFNRFFVIPKIGVGWTFDILQTNKPTPSYYLYNEKDHINIGISGGYYLDDKLAVQAGFGTFERFNIGIHYFIGNF